MAANMNEIPENNDNVFIAKVKRLSADIRDISIGLSTLKYVNASVKDPHLSEAVALIEKTREKLVNDKQQLLIEKEKSHKKKTSSYSYQWSWWYYVRTRLETDFPTCLKSSVVKYDCEIDAIMAACAAYEPVKCHRKHIQVLHLRKISEDSNEKDFVVKYGEMPLNDGGIPHVSEPLKNIYKNSPDMLEAVYDVYKESLTWDTWDGPRGAQFIVLETVGC